MLWQGLRRTHRAAVSCGYHFYTHEMKANDLGALTFIEMATHGIPNLLT